MMVVQKDLFKGRRALVTGAGTGIGAAVAAGLAAHGASVIAVGRTESTLAQTVEHIRSLGGCAKACVLDVADAKACDAAASRLAGESDGDVSMLVNAAGIIRYSNVDAPDIRKAWQDVLAVNLSGPFNTATAFLPQLRRTRGSIVNIGSIAGYIYTRNTPAYSAAKGGVHMLTTALARELGADGIRVNAVAPGSIATSMAPPETESSRNALAKRVPLGRRGQPEEMVGPVVFLLSEMASYVTGSVLVADGGYLTN